jgi:hypothetical protein
MGKLFVLRKGLRTTRTDFQFRTIFFLRTLYRIIVELTPLLHVIITFTFALSFNHPDY